MCSRLLAHRRQTAKKKDRPNLLGLQVRWHLPALHLRCIWFGWLRSPISIYQESEDDIEFLLLYHVHVSHTVLCHRLVKQHSRNDKKKKKKIVRWQCTKKLTKVSSYSESHTSHGRARHQIRDRSESGRSREVLTPGTSDSCRPRGVVIRDFGRLFDRLPVRILTSDLHHWILERKIFQIRAYDFGVQFSFKVPKKDENR